LADFFVFLLGLQRAAAFVLYPIHLLSEKVGVRFFVAHLFHFNEIAHQGFYRLKSQRACGESSENSFDGRRGKCFE